MVISAADVAAVVAIDLMVIGRAGLIVNDFHINTLLIRTDLLPRKYRPAQLQQPCEQPRHCLQV
jgi:hypothetical protein